MKSAVKLSKMLTLFIILYTASGALIAYFAENSGYVQLWFLWFSSILLLLLLSTYLFLHYRSNGQNRRRR